MRFSVGPRSLFWSLALGVLVVPSAGGQSKPRPNPQRQALNLFSSAAAILDANRPICAFANNGGICVSFGYGGGFWPQPTPDEYIFQSGFQIAGIVSPAAGFPWAGDTVGAYFVDTRGTSEHGDALALLFDSRNPDDLAQWPNGAIVRDTGVYAPSLIGDSAVADQDLWTRYWDGNPVFLSGRTHPMGVMVEQRVLAWNYPSGNEDIFYIVATLTNVTARDAAVYANGTIPPAVQPEIAAIGAQFQQLNEAQLGVAIPDGGYALEQVYLGLVMDHDVAVFSTNYSTVTLPFGIAYGYSGSFRPEFGWAFPLEVFGATPFVPLPGLMGTRFLRAPADLAMYSGFTGAATGHPDPVGVHQLWRYLSGNFGPSDAPCNVSPDPAVVRARKVCFVKGVQSDDRYSQSIGPFQLAPGESRSIVMAYIFAAPLDTATAYAGGDLPPGEPFPGDSIYLDTTRIRAIERIAGWRTQADGNSNSIIEEHEVVAAPRSLLQKAQLAQAFADHKFLLPEAPAQPGFFLIPGNRQVTIVWQRSASEETGDPYFAVAADPTSPLYDPTFRQFDVEGYRVYRGSSPNALTLVAQFDYQGTVMVDYTGTFVYQGQCAPELGILTDCPVAFPATPDPAVFVSHPLAGHVVQVPAGARIVSGNGALAVLRADTATAGMGNYGGYLWDDEVPFAYVDSGLTNSFPLYYAVTAFDVNSLRSGPSSFESPRLVKSVTPRVSAGQETGGAVTIEMLSAGGATLDPTAPLPTLNPATGIFAGPMPPTDAIAVRLTSFLPQVVGSGSITVAIDSVIPGMANLDVMPGRFRPTMYHFTRQGGGAPVSFTVALVEDHYEQPRTGEAPFEAIAVTPAQVSRFGGDSTYSLFGETGLTSAGTWVTTSFGRADANAQPGNSAYNGPRWWVGTANENEPNPNGGLCAPASGGCGNSVAVPLLALTAGSIPGVSIFHVQAYSTVPNAPMRNLEAMLSSVVRAADFRVFWGSGGTIDSVIDVTHGVPVPFHPSIRASWGILNQASFAATTATLTRDGNNGLLTWADIFCVAPSPTTMTDTIAGNCGGAAQPPAALQNTAALNPIAYASSSYTGTASLSATGTGFIFYLNGHFFLMQTAALPTAGTVWNARFYTGSVTGSAAGGNFAFLPTVRPPPVPGLRLRVTYQGTTLNTLAVTDSQLARVHTVPDPLYVASAYMTTPDTAVLRFVNLPSRAIIRIYSTSGILVAVLPHDDPTDGGEAVWNLRNRNGRRVASGVYFYHIETLAGRSRVGRFTVITFRP